MLISLVEPCKCSSTDHSHISAEACHLHMAPKSKRDRIEGIKEGSRTIKIGFNQFLAEPTLTYSIFSMKAFPSLLLITTVLCICHSKLLSGHLIVLTFRNKHRMPSSIRSGTRSKLFTFIIHSEL